MDAVTGVHKGPELECGCSFVLRKDTSLNDGMKSKWIGKIFDRSTGYSEKDGWVRT